MFKQRKPDLIERLAHLNPEPGPGGPDVSRGRRPLWMIGGLAVAGAAAAFVLFAVLGVDAGTPGDERAFAKKAIEVAEGNPRLLVGADGWSVEQAGEFEVDEGNMDFVNGEERVSIDWGDGRYFYEPEIPKQGLGEWSAPPEQSTCTAPVEEGERPGDYRPGGVIVLESGEREKLKLVDCEYRYRVVEIDFLGQRVLVQEDEHTNEGEEPSSSFSFRVPPSNGISVSLYASGMSAERFYEVLGSIYATDVETWLAALPPEVVRPVDRPEIVDEMLEGLPIHPDVDVEALREEAAAADRYGLGARVTGAVACAWLDQWAEGVRSGDQAAIDEATEAMSDSRDWPILREMADDGGWSQVIWEYSRDMRENDRKSLLDSAGTETINGKTWVLGPGYATGLGCDSEQRVLREEE
jgi:hypothetical protein